MLCRQALSRIPLLPHPSVMLRHLQTLTFGPTALHLGHQTSPLSCSGVCLCVWGARYISVGGLTSWQLGLQGEDTTLADFSFNTTPFTLQPPSWPPSIQYWRDKGLERKEDLSSFEQMVHLHPFTGNPRFHSQLPGWVEKEG